MDRKKLYAVHVGVSGFPFGSAAIYKCLAVYNVLAKGGINVLIINNKAIHNRNVPINIKKKDKFGQLEYIYTTPTPYKPKKFVIRRLYNIWGRINEFILLIKLLKNKRLDILIFYPKGNFFELLYYRLFSKVFDFPIVSHYVEYRTAFNSRRKINQKINDILFDKYFMKFVDGVFPISEFLIRHLKKRNYNKLYFKIPPIVDYRIFKSVSKYRVNQKYFLFVGSTSYYNTIQLIIDSFCIMDEKDYYLYLVLNGPAIDINKIKVEVEKLKKNYKIKIFSELKYSELIRLYIGAKALLIPLTDSLQDKARFPHKISEYLASKNPIITTNYGEIRYYFEDMKNALIAEKFDAVSFANKMEYVIRNEKSAIEIGMNGYRTGLKYFDSNSYSTILPNFLYRVAKK